MTGPGRLAQDALRIRTPSQKKNVQAKGSLKQPISAMSERLTAPARSPLRRTVTVGKDSPNRSKKSPLRVDKQDCKAPARVLDPEADALRAQAAEIEHDVNHLSPALQRFWQVDIFDMFLY